ncbi:MAG TPA: hypothetical protein VJB39_02200, partial [Patescibacteria group bacterium]|nr:hypothetical protein [Patescibacteria group bacterium]
MKLFKLQIIDHRKYLELAEAQHLTAQELIPNRGEIYIHDYESGGQELYPAAINKKYYQAFAIPEQVASPITAAKLLAPILEMDERVIYERLSKEADLYEPLKHKVDEAVKEQLEALALDGIRFEEEIFRFYPESEVLGQVIGFVGYQG